MNIFAVDTAVSACSVAILGDDRSVVVSQPMQRGHAEALMPMLARAFEQAGLTYDDIDRFAVTVGPGTFTGVRVGVAAIRGLSLATGKPAVAVTTLEALAATARSRATPSQRPLLIAMDARRDEVYAQLFAESGPQTAPMVIGIAELLDGLPGGPGDVFGSAAAAVAAAGAGQCRDLAVLGTDAAPDPLAIARIAASREPGEAPRPLYLRAPDAKPQAAARLARK